MKKIENKYVRTEYNNVPFVIGHSIGKMKQLTEANVLEKINNTVKQASLSNNVNINNKFLVDIDNIVKSEASKGIYTVTPMKLYTENNGNVMVEESLNETKRKIRQDIRNLACFDRKQVDTQNVLQYIHGISDSDLHTLYEQDETFNITYIDPKITTSNFTTVDNFKDAKELEYGSRYYYITRDNVKSFIRPMLDIPESIKADYKMLNKEDFQTRYKELIESGSDHSDIISGIYTPLSYLPNKIVITKTKRINLSMSLVSVGKAGTYPRGYIKHIITECPIVKEYIHKGYEVPEDEISKIVSEISEVIKSSAPTHDVKILNENVRTGVISFYDSIHVGPQVSSPLSWKVPETRRRNFSITIVKTDYVDVSQCSLDNEGTMYLAEHDIVLGVINTTFEKDGYSLLETARHPYSREELEKVKLKDSEEVPIPKLCIRHIVESLVGAKPIYVHTYGTITTIYPEEEMEMVPGLYIIEEGKPRLINPEDYIRYGIFVNKDQAYTHLKYLKSDFKDDKYSEEVLRVQKTELEKSKIDTGKELTLKEQEFRTVELVARRDELDARKELELRKSKSEKISTGFKVTKEIIISILGTATACIALYATILKNGGGNNK